MVQILHSKARAVGIPSLGNNNWTHTLLLTHSFLQSVVYFPKRLQIILYFPQKFPTNIPWGSPQFYLQKSPTLLFPSTKILLKIAREKITKLSNASQKTTEWISFPPDVTSSAPAQINSSSSPLGLSEGEFTLVRRCVSRDSTTKGHFSMLISGRLSKSAILFNYGVGSQNVLL